MNDRKESITDVRKIDFGAQLKKRFDAITPERKSEIAEINRRADLMELNKKKDAALAWTKKIDIRYRSVSFDNYKITHEDQQTAVGNLRKIAEDELPTQNVLLLGSTGTGKTHLAASLLHVVCRRFVRCDFLTGRMFVNELTNAARFQTEDTADSVIAGYARPQVLLLDDPAPATGLTGAQSWDLQELFDRRLNKCTVVTMNADTKERAADMLGAQVFSRLCDNALIIGCFWNDNRMTNGN